MFLKPLQARLRPFQNQAIPQRTYSKPGVTEAEPQTVHKPQVPKPGEGAVLGAEHRALDESWLLCWGSTTKGLTYLGDAVTLSLESPRKESEGSILITPSEGRAS